MAMTFIVVIGGSVVVRCLTYIRSIHKIRRCHASIVDTRLSCSYENQQSRVETTQTERRQIKTMVVLGSGGHTTEMIRLLEQLQPKSYSPVVYIVAHSDNTSVARLKKYIDNTRDSIGLKESGTPGTTRIGQWEGRYPIENESLPQTKNFLGEHLTSDNIPKMALVHRLPRPREVHQSYMSSILPTLWSIYKTFHLLQQEQPQLILANGPGVCVPLIYLVFLSRILRLSSCKIVFVESLCRVQSLSLSGKLVYPIVDQFVVHWPTLKQKYPLTNICDVFVGQENNE